MKTQYYQRIIREFEDEKDDEPMFYSCSFFFNNNLISVMILFLQNKIEYSLLKMIEITTTLSHIITLGKHHTCVEFEKIYD